MIENIQMTSLLILGFTGLLVWLYKDDFVGNAFSRPVGMTFWGSVLTVFVTTLIRTWM